MIIKHNGNIENFEYNKIYNRLNKLKYINYTLSNNIDINLICKKLLSMITDNIESNNIDILASEICANLIINHYDYGLLGARILVSNLDHKLKVKYNVETFTEITNLINLKIPNYLSESYVSFINTNKLELNKIINNEYNLSIDYFSFKTLERLYLIKDNNNNDTLETIQSLWLRVSISIHMRSENYLQKIKETYEYLALGKFIHATPTLFHSGTNYQQLSSCFLMGVDDNLENIFKNFADIAQISKWAGGIGLHLSNIRSKGQLIKKTNGISSGIIPILQILNNIGRYVNQSGKRNGSIAVYIEPWHGDILEFLELRKNNGNEIDKCRDLFLGLWICDKFMNAVINNTDWYLMSEDICPNLSNTYGDEFDKLYDFYVKEKKYLKKINATYIWNKIITSQMETGTPYILFKDHINNKSNQKNIGTIKSSNLCVDGNTKILTSEGYIIIKDYINKNVEVWNGEEWSNVKIFKTGLHINLIRVIFSNNTYIDCTEDHEFYIEQYCNNTKKYNIIKVSASNLKKNDKLIKFKLPNPIHYKINEEFNYPYTHGYYCGNNNSIANDKIIILNKNKNYLLKFFLFKNYFIAKNKINIILHNDINDKYTIPINSKLYIRLKWFEGLVDSCGHIFKPRYKYNKIFCNNYILVIINYNISFLIEVRYMLHTLGIESFIHKINDTYKFIINSTELYKLYLLGFSPKKNNFIIEQPNIDFNKNIKVVNITNSFQNVDTYCFTEPKKHMGVFNGILCSQCSEITEYSSSSEYSVCNLASIAVNKFYKNGKYDFNELHDIAKHITYNLNNIIDINYYPTNETKLSNLKNRPIGIGIQGFADLLAIMKLPYESKEAILLSANIMETIYHGSLVMSNILAKQYGPYDTYHGSPISQGIFQFNMWNVEPSMWDWNELKNNILKDGVRNSLTTALMPTASTSQILGNNECFEPYTTNLYTRLTLAGNFIVINKHLQKDLEELNLWNENIRNKLITSYGSVKNINEIPDNLKEIYKTVWEIKQKSIIDHAISRGPFVDQSQSMNLFFQNPESSKLTSALIYAWRNGLKTGMYYLRSQSSINTQQFTVELNNDNNNNDNKICLSCSS